MRRFAFVQKFKNYIWECNRKKMNERNMARLSEQGKTVSIISMNCTGGILYHDLGLRFLSPTINLFMRAEDFIKFCENLEYYLSIEKFIPCEDQDIIQGRTYPVAYLDDLVLFLVHYNSVGEAEAKWNERKGRINRDNIVILCADRDGMNDELKDRFEKLPYRKVMFTHLPDSKHESCYYISGYEEEASVGIITDHNSWDGRRPVDQFDYVELFGAKNKN